MQRQKQQAKKLQTKYLQEKEFQSQVDEKFKKYQILVQQSFYSDITCINEDLFVCYNQAENPIFLYFGLLQNSKKQFLHKLLLYFLKFFNRKPSELYTFVYINTRASSEAYSHFKQIFLQLPIDYFLFLKQFIFVRSSYYQRAQDYMSFNYFSNYLRNLTTYLGNCSELCSHLKISPQDFVDMAPKEIGQLQFPKLSPRNLSLINHRINFDGQVMDEKELVLKKQFQNVIRSFLIVKPGKQVYTLNDYELNKFGIPVILELLIYYFEGSPQGLKQQGIFRKSVAIDEENETLIELSNKNYNCLLNIQNPHIIANLIKRFFSNLKFPVFPYDKFHVLMHDQGIMDRKLLIKQVVKSLPQINYNSLTFLLNFLITKVISNSSFNKMPALNISICFAPCLLRAEKASMADMIYASKCAIVTRTMLQNFEQIFDPFEVIQEKYRKSQQDQSKKIEKNMRKSIQNEKKQRISNGSAASRMSYAQKSNSKPNQSRNTLKYSNAFQFSNNSRQMDLNPHFPIQIEDQKKEEENFYAQQTPM